MTDKEDDQLEQAFHALREVPPADRGRQASHRAAFLAQARQQRQAAPLSWGQRMRRWFGPPRRWATAGALLALVLVFLAGSGGVIYASDGAAPGDPLYGLDRAIEALRLRLTHRPQATTGLWLALAKERLLEVQTLSAQGSGKNLQAALENYGATISSLAKALGTLETADEASMTALLDKALSVHDKELAKALQEADSPPPPASEDEAPVVVSVEEVGDLPDLEDPPDVEEPPDMEEPADCVGADPHPVAQSLAESYEVPYEDIMRWFCDGFGFGEIMHALQTSEVTELSPEELLDLKLELGGWGQVWQEQGLIGRARKADDNPDLIPVDQPGKQPGGPDKDKPNKEPGGPKPKKEKPDNPGQSKKGGP